MKDREALAALSRRAFMAGAGASVVLTVLSRPAAALAGPSARESGASARSWQSDFVHPPMDARPRLWWFWGESITTDEGITRDLESFKRVGLGGVVLYEQVFVAAPDSLASLSPAWLDRVRFAAAECARLGLSLEVNVSNGYVAGGPWITPGLAMQRLVASETHIAGGREQRIVLPQPATRLDYYRDVACLAYPAVAGGKPLPTPAPSANSSDIDPDQLGGTKKVRIKPRADGGPVLIRFDYGGEVTLRSLSFAQRKNSKALVIATQLPGQWGPEALGQGMHRDPPLGRLESSNDGKQWRPLVELPAMGYSHDNWDRMTLSFPAATARYFRLNLQGWGRNRAGDDDLLIAEVELLGAARIDRWESKSGNIADFSDPDRTPAYGKDEVVDPANMIDLSANLQPDGTLSWLPPPGDWTVLRLGHTPTGAKTKHGHPSAAGLESDKLSAHATRVQFGHYIGPILAAVQGVQGARIEGISIDSAEHGSQNWTPDFLAQFRKRRGYDLLHFLPAMMGIPVQSVAASDRILFDVRRTIADLMSDEYFGAFTALANAAGMTVTAHAPGIATCLPSDNIQAKGRVDIPMGEFWVSKFNNAGQPEGTMDCREAASAAHLYGRRIVAAEAFTGSPAHVHPAMLKPFADAAFVNGINRIVVLAGNHQPYGDRRKPGVTEDKFFLPYQRNNTWWEQSRGFWDTLARSSFMLRQGQPVVDLLYHLGSDTPLKIATARMQPAPPAGHDYDVCGDEELLRARVENGDLLMPGGMRYPVLVLAGGEAMTLAAARHLLALVRGGARVIAPVKGLRTPTFADGAVQAELAAIADELWGKVPLPASAQRRVGSGLVMWGAGPDVHLQALGIGRDFRAIGRAGLDVLCTHRRTADGEIYFIANHRPQPISVEVQLRDGRGLPQAWDPATGKRFLLPGARKPSVDASGASGAVVPLRLEQFGSLFVVFGPAAPAEAPLPPLAHELASWKIVQGPWKVSFELGWGAPASITLPALASWTRHALEGVRHYSGSALYSCEISLPQAPRGPLWIDLGQVEVVATLSINGKDAGTLWKPPYAAEISRLLHAGVNRLEVRVANLWANRLIADAGLPAEQRVSWTTFNPYKAGDELYPSGLIGPVTLRTRRA